MNELPNVQPQFAPQPVGVAWPSLEWPRGASPHQGELEHVVDQMFCDEQLAVTNAVVVVQGGRVFVERYGGEQVYFDRPATPITAQSPLLSWSMAKSVLHRIIGTLVDDRRLDPDQLAPVSEWSEPDDPRRQIRVRDLLTMRDGLAFVEQYEIGQMSHVIEMLYGEGQDDMAAYTARLPLAHQPDTFFNYSSGTTNVLSRIVADLVGYDDAYLIYLHERLFAPISMTSVSPSRNFLLPTFPKSPNSCTRRVSSTPSSDASFTSRQRLAHGEANSARCAGATSTRNFRTITSQLHSALKGRACKSPRSGEPRGIAGLLAMSPKGRGLVD